MSSGRFYIRKDTVPFDEDFTHEFKGHRNISIDDQPPWTQETKTERASRRAVSRTLNAFLNTGQGGTVYLGVVDSGTVRGMQLTQYQKDHVVGSVDDLMSRYNPHVKQHRYKVKFVPVVDSKEQGQKLAKESNQADDEELRQRPHQFRTHLYCWCDKDSVMQYNAGLMHQDYIIEIKIKPWDPNNILNQTETAGSLINIQQIHEDEEGNCYFRRQASLVKYSITEIAQLTRQEVQEGCLQKIRNLKREISELQNATGKAVD